MIEDTIYRTSSQFRIWSFTEESLRSIRTKTNALASDRVRAAIRRAREPQQPQAQAASSSSAAGTPTPTSTPAPNEKEKDNEIKCLTPDEEQELVRYYCEKTLELGDEYKPPLPTIVRATAIQYLHRFYLTNSPMTYHPKTIMPCALFLATKTENYYMSLRQFADKIPGDTTPEDVIAPEFLLIQSLRFTFDVRHPFRGLEGGIMELNAIANGMGQPAPHLLAQQTAEGLRRGLLSTQSQLPHQQHQHQQTGITDRIARAHHKAREILKSAAQITDVYFLFTPAQIWLAAFFLADSGLAEFYLSTKLGPDEQPVHDQRGELSSLRTKLKTTLSNCSNMLQAYKPLSSDIEQMKNLKRIAKKLYHCQNPEKVSGSGGGIAAGQKRDVSSSAANATSAPPSGTAAAAAAGGGGAGEGGGDAEAEHVAKRRKVESEAGGEEGKKEVFGGELRR